MGLIVAGVTGIVVLALVVGLLYNALGRTSTTTGATTGPTGTSSAQPGQKISIPPVPSPTASVSRSGTQPDRPNLPIPAVKPPGFVDPPSGSGMSRYVEQRLTWSADACVDSERKNSRATCANVAAPLDYTKPDGQAITLHLTKVPATATPKLGSLFVNPGGPGSGGGSLAVRFERTGLEMYDIIGWDPRGTGSSTPVVCHNGAEIDAMREVNQAPTDEAGRQALIQSWTQFGAGCLEKSGPLLQHISTLDTVEDLDLLRQVVGDKELNYLGYSYGTFIGAVYAEKHASTVGKLVLDSAVNITNDESVVQASGFDLALGNYAKWCADGGCSLGSSKEAVLSNITSFLDKLATAPVPVGNRKLTQSIAVDGIALFLYFDSSEWDLLTSALKGAEAGNATALMRAADSLRDREPNGQYTTSYFAFPAISCADWADDGLARAFADWKLDEQKAPIFGKYFGPSINCSVWPVPGTKPLDIKGAGAKPIVVVGAVGDSATPYQYAVWMAKQLESGVLVTYSGNGHATYGNDKSTCVDQTVVSYFAKGTVPPNGLYCD